MLPVIQPGMTKILQPINNKKRILNLPDEFPTKTLFMPHVNIHSMYVIFLRMQWITCQ